MQVRDATPGDFDGILALNEASVEFLSPLDADRLSLLHDASAYHRVLDDHGVVTAFLLALREGTAYESPNYRWFSARYSHFLYVDRIVVSRETRSAGAGSLLYRDLFAFAADAAIPLVTCEYDVEPPNDASARFHARFGFEEVGRQEVACGKKVVALQAAEVRPRRDSPPRRRAWAPGTEGQDGSGC